MSGFIRPWDVNHQTEEVESAKPERSLFDNFSDAFSAMSANFEDVRGSERLGGLRNELMDSSNLSDDEYNAKRAEYVQEYLNREDARRRYQEAQQNLVDDDSKLQYLTQIGGTVEGMAAQALGTAGGAAIGALASPFTAGGSIALGAKIGNAVGAVGGAYLDANSVALQAEEEVLDAGGTWEQAKQAYNEALKKASLTTLPETAVDIMMGNRLVRSALGSKAARNIAGSVVGRAGSAVLDPAAKVGTAVSRMTRPIVGRAAGLATDVALQGITEAGQEVTQDYIANREVAKALGQADNEYSLGGFGQYAMSPEGLETMKTAGIMGAVFGGAGGALSSGQYLQKGSKYKSSNKIHAVTEKMINDGKLSLNEKQRQNEEKIISAFTGISPAQLSTWSDADIVAQSAEIRGEYLRKTSHLDETQDITGVRGFVDVINGVGDNQQQKAKTEGELTALSNSALQEYGITPEDRQKFFSTPTENSLIEKAKKELQKQTEQQNQQGEQNQQTKIGLTPETAATMNIQNGTVNIQDSSLGGEETTISDMSQQAKQKTDGVTSEVKYKDNVGDEWKGFTEYTQGGQELEGKSYKNKSNGKVARITQGSDGAFYVLDTSEGNTQATRFETLEQAENHLIKNQDNRKVFQGVNQQETQEKTTLEKGEVDADNGVTGQHVSNIDDLFDFIQKEPDAISPEAFMEFVDMNRRIGTEGVDFYFDTKNYGYTKDQNGVYHQVRGWKQRRDESTGRALIQLYRGSDINTAVHEVAHLGYENLSKEEKRIFDTYAVKSMGRYIADLLNINYDQNFRNRLLNLANDEELQKKINEQPAAFQAEIRLFLNGGVDINNLTEDQQRAIDERWAWEFTFWYMEGYVRGVKPENIIQRLLNRSCIFLDKELKGIRRVWWHIHHKNSGAESMYRNENGEPMNGDQQIAQQIQEQEQGQEQEQPIENGAQQPIEQPPVVQQPTIQQPYNDYISPEEEQTQFMDSTGYTEEIPSQYFDNTESVGNTNNINNADNANRGEQTRNEQQFDNNQQQEQKEQRTTENENRQNEEEETTFDLVMNEETAEIFADEGLRRFNGDIEQMKSVLRDRYKKAESRKEKRWITRIVKIAEKKSQNRWKKEQTQSNGIEQGQIDVEVVKPSGLQQRNGGYFNTNPQQLNPAIRQEKTTAPQITQKVNDNIEVEEENEVEQERTIGDEIEEIAEKFGQVYDEELEQQEINSIEGDINEVLDSLENESSKTVKKISQSVGKRIEAAKSALRKSNKEVDKGQEFYKLCSMSALKNALDSRLKDNHYGNGNINQDRINNVGYLIKNQLGEVQEDWAKFYTDENEAIARRRISEENEIEKQRKEAEKLAKKKKKEEEKRQKEQAQRASQNLDILEQQIRNQQNEELTDEELEEKADKELAQNNTPKKKKKENKPKMTEEERHKLADEWSDKNEDFIRKWREKYNAKQNAIQNNNKQESKQYSEVVEGWIERLSKEEDYDEAMSKLQELLNTKAIEEEEYSEISKGLEEHFEGQEETDEKAEQAQQILNKAFPNTRFQFAWHSTPHDFNKFTLEHLLSGEGAMAHGWGLYFSREMVDNKGQYFDTFYEAWKGKKKIENHIKDEKIEQKLRKLFRDAFGFSNIFDRFIDNEINKDRLIKDVEEELEQKKKMFASNKKMITDIEKSINNSPSSLEFWRNVIPNVDKMLKDKQNGFVDAKKQINSLSNIIKILKGDQVYTEEKQVNASFILVNIPENEYLLKEVGRFDKQSKFVQRQLLKLMKDQKFTKPKMRKVMNSAKIYDELCNIISGGMYFRNGKEVSILLNKYGIKGMQYDGATDINCVVVFDDKCIDIISKFQKVEGEIKKTQSYKDNKTELTDKQKQRAERKLQEKKDRDLEKVKKGKQILEKAFPNKRFQFAYHGTAHNFNDFSLKYVGTGQGLQEHGWGLYFTKAIQGAYNYYRTFNEDEDSIKDTLTIGGKKHQLNSYSSSFWGSFAEGLRDKIEKSNLPQTQIIKKEIEKTLRGLDKNFWLTKGDETENVRKELQKFLFEINNTNDASFESVETENEKGQIIKVEVPDDNKLLREGSNFNGQPKYVQQKLLKLFKSVGLNGQRLRKVYNSNNIYKQLRSTLKMNGEELSRLMSKNGIDGISYNALQDGECAVIFNEKAISIMDRFKEVDYEWQYKKEESKGINQEDLQKAQKKLEKHRQKESSKKRFMYDRFIEQDARLNKEEDEENKRIQNKVLKININGKEEDLEKYIYNSAVKQHPDKKGRAFKWAKSLFNNIKKDIVDYLDSEGVITKSSFSEMQDSIYRFEIGSNERILNQFKDEMSKDNIEMLQKLINDAEQRRVNLGLIQLLLPENFQIKSPTTVFEMAEAKKKDKEIQEQMDAYNRAASTVEFSVVVNDNKANNLRKYIPYNDIDVIRDDLISYGMDNDDKIITYKDIQDIAELNKKEAMKYKNLSLTSTMDQDINSDLYNEYKKRYGIVKSLLAKMPKDSNIRLVTFADQTLNNDYGEFDNTNVVDVSNRIEQKQNKTNGQNGNATKPIDIFNRKIQKDMLNKSNRRFMAGGKFAKNSPIQNEEKLEEYFKQEMKKLGITDKLLKKYGNIKNELLDTRGNVKESRELFEYIKALNKINKRLWKSGNIYRGLDGTWRFWISDNKAKLEFGVQDLFRNFRKQIQSGSFNQPEFKLEDIMSHKDLFKYYPQLRKMKVTFYSSQGDRTGGYYNHLTDEIGINVSASMFDSFVEGNDNDFLTMVLLHELQHAIQGTEGFAHGDNERPSFYISEDKNDVLKFLYGNRDLLYDKASESLMNKREFEPVISYNDEPILFGDGDYIEELPPIFTGSVAKIGGIELSEQESFVLERIESGIKEGKTVEKILEEVRDEVNELLKQDEKQLNEFDFNEEDEYNEEFDFEDAIGLSNDINTLNATLQFIDDVSQKVGSGSLKFRKLKNSEIDKFRNKEFNKLNFLKSKKKLGEVLDIARKQDSTGEIVRDNEQLNILQEAIEDSNLVHEFYEISHGESEARDTMYSYKKYKKNVPMQKEEKYKELDSVEKVPWGEERGGFMKIRRYMFYANKAKGQTALTEEKEKQFEKDFRKVANARGFTNKFIDDYFSNYKNGDAQLITNEKLNEKNLFNKSFIDFVDDYNKEMVKKYGVKRDLDGRWVGEFSDENSRVKPYYVGENYLKSITSKSEQTKKLSDVLIHNELFKYYPHLKGAKVIFTDTEGIRKRGGNETTFAAYFKNKDGEDCIVVNSEKLLNQNKDDKTRQNKLRTNLLHEIQHAIQNYEGIAGGAGLSALEETRLQKQMLDDYAKGLGTTIDNIGDKFVQAFGNKSPYVKKHALDIISGYINNLQNKNNITDAEQKRIQKYCQKLQSLKTKNKDLYNQFVEPLDQIRNLYWKTLGEIRARQTEQRADMTMEERNKKTGLLDEKYSNFPHVKNAPITVHNKVYMAASKEQQEEKTPLEKAQEQRDKRLEQQRKAGITSDFYKDVYSVTFTESAQNNEENKRKMKYFDKRSEYWDRNEKDGKVTYTRKTPFEHHQQVVTYNGINDVIKEQKKKSKPAQWAEWFKDQLIKYAFNDMHFLAKAARKLGKFDAYTKLVVTKGYALKANTAMERGIKYNGKYTRALNDIIKEVGEEKQHDFVEYCIAKRILDMKELRPEIRQKMSPEEAAELIEKYENGENAELFKKNQKDFVKYNHALLHVLVDGGVMTEEEFQHHIKNDPNFVPLAKVMDDADFGFNGIQAARSIVNIKSPIKPIGTSFREVKNPFLEMQKRTAEYYSIAARNKAGQIFVNEIAGAIDKLANGDVVAKGQGMIRKVKVDEKDGKLITKPDPNQQIIYVCNNGKNEFYQVSDPEIYRALRALDADQMGTLQKIIDPMLHAPSALIRETATMVPDFGVRNLLRDGGEAFMTSEHGFLPFIDQIWGMYQMANNTEWYQRFLEQQGEYGTYNRDGAQNDVARVEDTIDEKVNPIKNFNEIRRAAFEKFTNKKNSKATRAAALLQLMGSMPYAVIKSNKRINDYLEMGTRIGEFKNAKMGYKGTLDRLSKGGILDWDANINNAKSSDILAAGAAKEITLNFGQHGIIGKQLNRYIPFFNATLQGIYKMCNALELMATGTTLSGEKNHKLQGELLFKAALVTAMAIGVAAAGEGDDDYEEANQYEKENFWILPNGLRFPKDQVLGKLFGNVAEKSYAQWRKGKFEPSDILRSIIENFTPDKFMPAMADITLGGLFNYDTFYKSAIVPEYMQGKLGHLQKDLSTSNMAADISDFLWKYTKTDVSAKRLDWALQKNLTNCKKYIDSIYDLGKQAYDPKSFNEKMARGYDKNDSTGAFVGGLKDDVPKPLSLVTGTFATNRTNYKSISDFYEKYNEYKKLATDEKSMSKDEKRAWKRYEQAYKKDMVFRKQLRAIKGDNSLTGKQKREKADKIFKQQIKLAKWAEG